MKKNGFLFYFGSVTLVWLSVRFGISCTSLFTNMKGQRVNKVCNNILDIWMAIVMHPTVISSLYTFHIQIEWFSKWKQISKSICLVTSISEMCKYYIRFDLFCSRIGESDKVHYNCLVITWKLSDVITIWMQLPLIKSKMGFTHSVSQAPDSGWRILIKSVKWINWI